MKPFMLAVLACLLFATASIAQTYDITFEGNKVGTDLTPTSTKITNGSTTIQVSISGSDITVTMGDSGQGLWSAHIMSGQTGNNKFVAILTNGDKSVYTIRGTINKKKISGNFIYFRHGSRPNIVPGWTSVRFKGNVQ